MKEINRSSNLNLPVCAFDSVHSPGFVITISSSVNYSIVFVLDVYFSQTLFMCFMDTLRTWPEGTAIIEQLWYKISSSCLLEA